MKDKPDAYWKEKLTPEQYKIMREKGTEAPFSGELLNNDEAGMYACAACGAQLFPSDAKFDTRMPGLAGWPSFEDAIPGAVEFREDTSDGMRRTEVVCANCGAHLGHIFDDATETKTGKHYCINSSCLNFQAKET